MGVRFALLISFLNAAILAAGSDPNTASIQGTVTARDTKKPLAGALVIARATPAFSTHQSAQSAADGSFQLQNLPAGTYSLCVKPADDGYLDPCEWGQTASSVTVTAGQKSTGNLPTASAGSVLKIRIQDTAQLLFQKGKSGYLPDLLVGIFGPNGMFYPAHVANRDIRGLDLQLTIPFNTPLSLSVTSKAAKLADSTGVALPAGGAQAPFQHATGNPSPPSFTYTVTGVVP
jgi:hypothetical protein